MAYRVLKTHYMLSFYKFSNTIPIFGFKVSLDRTHQDIKHFFKEEYSIFDKFKLNTTIGIEKLLYPYVVAPDLFITYIFTFKGISVIPIYYCWA